LGTAILISIVLVVVIILLFVGCKWFKPEEPPVEGSCERTGEWTTHRTRPSLIPTSILLFTESWSIRWLWKRPKHDLYDSGESSPRRKSALPAASIEWIIGAVIGMDSSPCRRTMLMNFPSALPSIRSFCDEYGEAFAIPQPS
jgi:hypothetical protein